MPEPRTPAARTPLHFWHVAHGARLVEQDGWQVVADYGGAAKKTVGGLAIADVSACAKISLRGPGLNPLLEALLPGASARPHGVAAVPDLGALACRLMDDHLLLLSSTPSASLLAQRLGEVPESRSLIRMDATSAYAGFALIGERVPEVLARLTSLDLRPASFPCDACAETALAGVEALLVRIEGSSRIYVAWDLAEYVWEAILRAGRSEGIMPLAPASV